MNIQAQYHFPFGYLCPMGEYSIGDAMKKFLESSRLRGDIQALQIGDAWEAIMGKTVARYTDKIQIIGDKLLITTQVAPLKNELKFQKEKIKQRVNEALGQKIVNEVIIQ
ncbi:MAG: DUF721 domain-containing protein [Bacteroidetes bacterium]|nr:DUF721 domain-containing protein [Bacteroidota bacterium]